MFSSFVFVLFNIFVNNLSKKACRISLFEDNGITLFNKMYFILFLISRFDSKNDDK